MGRHDKKHLFFNDIVVGNNIRQDFTFSKTIGKGSFSTVKKATFNKTGEEVAVKIIDKGKLNVSESSLKTEVKILQTVDHESVVKLYRVYEDSDKIYLVMEMLTGGELFDRIVNEYPSGYSERTASTLIGKIISAIQYLHSKQIVHRDLKPENLLFASPKSNRNVKITDFGLSKIAKGSVMLKTACGTPNYVAPEVLLNEGYDEAVDMWSIGVIMYILLCGFPPFYSENTPHLFDLIIGGRYDFPEEYWGSVSDSAKDLITRLLEVNPADRYTPDQALEHPWIKGTTAVASVNESVVLEMRKWNAMRKFRVAVETIVAGNRFLQLLMKQ
eukprot:gb/GECH01006890.1/.p1 GENE.gb/GECH01006890.1/~~gb/GECH01006890.1/.p1  ORF type:complete len:329 (+),score=52.64 gb/GECH01006890.1/:1-987(+)